MHDALHVTGWEFVAIAVVVFAGALLQGIIGFGMVIAAFPTIVLVEPELLPQTMLVVSTPMVLRMVWRYRGDVRWREVGWFLAGRPVGLVAAAFVVGWASTRTLTLAAGGSVLVAIALSLFAPPVPRTRLNLAIGGSLSSLFGTAVAIGGPPVGLLYQRDKGDELRATVSAIMLLGAPLGLTVLALGGQFDLTDLRTGAALSPFALAGVSLAPRVAPRFDERLRPLILGVCAVAALGAMARVV